MNKVYFISSWNNKTVSYSVWSDLPKTGTTKKMDLISLWGRKKQFRAKTWLIKLTTVF
jgi:hypothetical protein